MTNPWQIVTVLSTILGSGSIRSHARLGVETDLSCLSALASGNIEGQRR